MRNEYEGIKNNKEKAIEWIRAVNQHTATNVARHLLTMAFLIVGIAIAIIPYPLIAAGCALLHFFLQGKELSELENNQKILRNIQQEENKYERDVRLNGKEYRIYYSA